MTINATYAKLRSGDWGIRSTAALRAGDSIAVTKRDGSTKTETVAKIVFTGGGVTLAAIASGAPASSPSRFAHTGAGKSASNVGGYSSYCTNRANCRCFDCAS